MYTFCFFSLFYEQSLCYTKSGSAEQPYDENHGQRKWNERHFTNVAITPVITISALHIWWWYQELSKRLQNVVQSFSLAVIFIASHSVLRPILKNALTAGLCRPYPLVSCVKGFSLAKRVRCCQARVSEAVLFLCKDFVFVLRWALRKCWYQHPWVHDQIMLSI